MVELIPIKRVRDAFPSWPYSDHGTWRLIRLGRLRCVRVGRNKFLTAELIEEFAARHTHEGHPCA